MCFSYIFFSTSIYIQIFLKICARIFTYLFPFLYMYLSIPYIHLSISLSIKHYISLSVSFFMCVFSIHVSVYATVLRSPYPSIHPSVHPPLIGIIFRQYTLCVGHAPLFRHVPLSFPSIPPKAPAYKERQGRDNATRLGTGSGSFPGNVKSAKGGIGEEKGGRREGIKGRKYKRGIGAVGNGGRQRR